ncbi:acyl-coenzyme A amino acid N-acyltransferase 2-like [Nycticebus coucang]|uniref:acyl-coenzyme A amino acid N-acyltransferase 2-like n=1 Tax=Nycticebus coucang TaxID=9470 RepID=UPI00234C8493|nr:acyl-coenzyme A amino acid N-acyltransferase 2-like [Nycticebus coucang]
MPAAERHGTLEGEIQRSGIGVISVCMGAEIVLAMACYLKQVVAVVCINGFNAVIGVPLQYKDLVVTPIHPDMEQYTGARLWS